MSYNSTVSHQFKPMSAELLKIVKNKECNKYDDYIQVPVYNEIYYDFVTSLADKYGVKPEVTMNYKERIPCKLTIKLSSGLYHYNMMDSVESPDIPLDELESVFAYIKNKTENKIKIAGYIVEFNDNGSINVGCTTIPFSTVYSIYKVADRKNKEYEKF